MSKPYLRFEDGKVSLGNKDLMVQSASLSISPTLEPERVYGDVDINIVGAKTEFIDFAPLDGLKGKLDISFMITDELFGYSNGVNAIDKLFDIRDGMGEDPIHGNIVGRYFFNNMYLTSFSFSLAPYRVIQANATYDIYGTILKTVDRRFQELSIDPAHGLKSFGKVKASNTEMSAVNGRQFEVSQMDYSITVGRKVHNNIRDSEHTSLSTNANGVAPHRVSVENIEVEMMIEANDIAQKLSQYGEYHGGNARPVELNRNSSIAAYLYSMNGNRIAKFQCEGKIQEQSVSLGEGNYSRGRVVVKQIVK